MCIIALDALHGKPQRTEFHHHALLLAKVSRGIQRNNSFTGLDILSRQLHIWNPAAKEDKLIELEGRIGAVVPTVRGDLVAAIEHGFARIDPESGAVTPLVEPEAGLEDNRFNDGKCDAAGRFYAGTMEENGARRSGAFYRLDPDLSVHKLLDNIGISNGIAWWDDIMYYIDTLDCAVSSFSWDRGTGDISNRRTVIKLSLDDGNPDGMTIDAEGMLWIALCGGSRVIRCDPGRGTRVDEFRFPVSMITNCVFGGKNLDELFVSSAKITLSDEELPRRRYRGSLRSQRGWRGVGCFCGCETRHSCCGDAGRLLRCRSG